MRLLSKAGHLMVENILITSNNNGLPATDATPQMTIIHLFPFATLLPVSNIKTAIKETRYVLAMAINIHSY